MAYPIKMNTLKAKINIAKTQLGMDEDVYRSVLKAATGKSSLKEMNFADLMMVMHSMEQRGFKAKKPANKTPIESENKSRSSGQTAYSRKGQDKIAAIWITMHNQGFIEDGSAQALDKFVSNQTAKTGRFRVDSVRFLTPPQASAIIEVLKKWHIRVMSKSLKQQGACYGPTPLPYYSLVDFYASVAPVQGEK